jgi:hypothetical protein
MSPVFLNDVVFTSFTQAAEVNNIIFPKKNIFFYFLAERTGGCPIFWVGLDSSLYGE